MNQRIPLPIDAHLDRIVESLSQHPNLVLAASPGSGKTTRVPIGLLRSIQESEGKTGKILVLEPRRVAAISSALRVCEENNLKLKFDVGYWVRFASEFTSDTPLVFLTEALLTRHMQENPKLAEVNIVILDEFHERSIHTDLAIGLLRELQMLERPDLKILVMSATLNAEPLSKFLSDAPIIEVPGKLHSLQIIHDTKSQHLQTGPLFVDKVVDKIKALCSRNLEGDILVFLPGKGEIERVRRALPDSLPRRVEVLHGGVSLDEQSRVLRRSPDFPRIILATNLAESALTIDGVRVVVDTGLERVASIHPQTGRPQLSLQRISLSSATQRGGRSARQGPGEVHRLWTKLDESTMPKELPAEIHRTELASTLLFLADQGVQDFRSFSWYELPDPKLIMKAERELADLQLIEKQNGLWQITTLGKRALKYPIRPELARLIFQSEKYQISLEGIKYAAVLAELPNLRLPQINSMSGPLGKERAAGAGLESDPQEIFRFQMETKNLSFQRAFDQLCHIFARETGKSPTNEHSRESITDTIPEVLLASFPSNLCRRRKPGVPTAVLAHKQRGIELAETSCVKSSEYFIALDFFEREGNKDTSVTCAVGLPESMIKKKIQQESIREKRILWVEERQEFYSTSLSVWRGLSIEHGDLQLAAAEELQPFLQERCTNAQEELLRKNSKLSNLFVRYSLWSRSEKAEPMNSIPANWIEFACYGETRWQNLLTKDWTDSVQNSMPPEHWQKFNSDVPEKMELPSGRWNPVHYPPDRPPYIECKIQDVFGLKVHPQILGQKVVFNLLGPNLRPVQVTSDIPGFWKSSYPEIRKELKARYPKHKWPERPDEL